MIDNGFGGNNETVTQDHFEALVGGPKRAAKLLYLWKTAFKCDMRPQGKLHTREDIFEKNAKTAGFTKQQILCFYDL